MFILNNNKMLEENFQTFNFNKIIESYKVFTKKEKRLQSWEHQLTKMDGSDIEMEDCN